MRPVEKLREKVHKAKETPSQEDKPSGSATNSKAIAVLRPADVRRCWTGSAGDDWLCWSTVAGLALIHVAGVAGVVWIVVHPSLPTLGCRCVLRGVRPVDHRRLPPSLRPSHLPARRRRAMGPACLRCGDVPELGAVVERRPSGPPRRHRRRRRPPRRRHGRLVRPRRLAVPPARRVGRRHPAERPVGRAQHPAAAPLLRVARRRVGLVAAGAHRGPVGRLLGRSPRRRVPARRRHAADDVLHQLAGPPRRAAALRRAARRRATACSPRS